MYYKLSKFTTLNMEIRNMRFYINNKINLKCPLNNQHNTECIWEQEYFGHLIVQMIFLKVL